MRTRKTSSASRGGNEPHAHLVAWAKKHPEAFAAVVAKFMPPQVNR
jgi:hypothetical protein